MQKFILVGLDHGTSNSCIAIMGGNGPEILHADNGNPESEIMPSYIHLSEAGGLLIGSQARNAALVNYPPGTGYSGYKTRIGSDDLFDFPEVHKVFSAPEMGKLVIGRLLESCTSKLGYPPLAAVVTVPAKFNQAQYDGTRKAAELAGLRQVVLLQEPIAASLAYGFVNRNDFRAIVFDLGGGTLDVSLVVMKNGSMEIPEKGNCGDADLGGRIFDAKLMEYVLGPRKKDSSQWNSLESIHRQYTDSDYSPLRRRYSLENFNERNNPNEWGRLRLAVEEAKIALSSRSRDTVKLEGELCRDEQGKPVEIEIPVCREVYERLIESDIARAVNCCRTLLKENHLRADQIDHIIMVGGPSKTPYIQKILCDRLGIRLKADIDPMIVVAQGAAIFAANKELSPEISEELRQYQPPAAIDVKWFFEAFSENERCTVSAQVGGGELDDYSDLSVRIVRSDNGWEKTFPVEADGWVEAELSLIQSDRPVQSCFTATVADSRGNLLSTSEDLRIWHPMGNAPEAKLANSMMIATTGNNTRILLNAGITLPAVETQEFRTVADVRKGNNRDGVTIKVLEGVCNLLGREDRHADCNIKVGTLNIMGNQLKADLPANSVIHITLEEDESREVSVSVSVPPYGDDDKFSATFNSREDAQSVPSIRKAFLLARHRLAECRNLNRSHPNQNIDELFEMMEDERIVEDIEDGLDKIDDGQTELTMAVYKKFLCLNGTLHCIYDLQQEIRIAMRFEKLTEEAARFKLHSEGQTGADKIRNVKNKLNDLTPVFEEAKQAKDKTAMVKVEAELDKVASDLYYLPIIFLACDWAAMGYCLTNRMDEFLMSGAENLTLWLEVKEHLDALSAKAGAPEFSMDAIEEYAKNGMMSEEEMKKNLDLYFKMEAVPRMNEMVREWLNSRNGQTGGGNSTEDDGLQEPQ